MRFAASLLVFSAACTADADSPYPGNNSTELFLACDKATFDPAGAAASASPTSASDCATRCKNDTFNLGDYMDNNGHAVGLSADKYAGCSFPTLYNIEQEADPCMYNSTKGNGFFAVLDSNVMLTKDDFIGAFMWPRMTTTAVPGVSTWQIYRASSQVESCPGVAPDESWITGNAVSAPAARQADSYDSVVNLTEFYKTTDLENGKMHLFAVPGNADNVVADSTFWSYTWSTGPAQVGVSAACGAITDCTSCVPRNCPWCQLTMGGVTSGLCGVTEGQCHALYSPSAAVGWYLDQCNTPEFPSTTSTSTTKQAVPTKTTTAAPTTAAGASPLMLSVAGAVLLGAAVAL